MRWRKVSLLLLLPVAFAGAVAARPASDEMAIRDLERQWVERLHDHDVGWIVDLHLPDARQFPPGEPPVVGVNAIRAAWQSMVDTAGLALTWEPTEVTVAGSGDLAYDIGTGTLTTPDGARHPVKYVVVWKKREGRWKVALDMFSRND